MNVLERSKLKLWKNEIAVHSICLYPVGTTRWTDFQPARPP